MTAVDTGSQALDALLAEGADVDASDNEGRIALMLAAQSRTPGAVKTLLRFKPDLDARDQHGFTALRYAVENHDIESVYLLIAAGADVDISDNEGVTPLKRARLLDRYSVIGYVLAAKANPCANSGE